MDKKKKQTNKKKRRERPPIKKFIAMFFIICVSLGLILYPFISNYIFEHQASGIVNSVEKSIDDTASDSKQKEYKNEIKAAQKYNADIANGHIQLKDPFDEKSLEEDEKEYDSLLNMTKDGVMGVIKIPCINVSLPIYHGTSESTLEKGVGHLQGTSLPVGGKSTHTVLTGHTGLSRAKLFTDLTELKEGDMFFLYVMGKTMTYKVDKISVVLPSEMNSLTVEPGKDFCTLVTCTPYGVNSHRLLVRGIRTRYVSEADNPEIYEQRKVKSQWQEEYAKSIVISSITFIILLVILIIWREVPHNKKRKKKLKRKKNRKRKEP